MFFFIKSSNKNTLTPLRFEVSNFNNENSNFQSEYNLNVISPDDYCIKSLNSKVIDTQIKIMLPRNSFLHIKRSNCCKKQVFDNNADLIESKNHLRIKEEIIKAKSNKCYTNFYLNITVYNVSHEKKIMIKKSEKICEVIFNRGTKNDKQYNKLLQLEEKLENKFRDFEIESKNLLFLKSQQIKESHNIKKWGKEHMNVKNKIKTYMDWKDYEEKQKKKEKIKKKLEKHRQKYLIFKKKISTYEKVQPLTFFNDS